MLRFLRSTGEISRRPEPAEPPEGSFPIDTYLIGDPPREAWFQSMKVAPDGSVVNTIEQVDATTRKEGESRRALTDAQIEAIARAPGLTFPDPVEPPPAP